MTQPAPIQFEGRLPYRRLPNQGPCPFAQVTLRLNGNEVTAFAVLDSGASVTVFQRELAAQLGIDDITTGLRDDVSTGGGPVASYLFDVDGVAVGRQCNNENDLSGRILGWPFTTKYSRKKSSIHGIHPRIHGTSGGCSVQG